MELTFEVENFVYNGFIVQSKKGKAKYTATFKEWTNDPGIALYACSDGKDRLIPSCCLIGDGKLPKQEYTNKVLFGKKSTS